MAYATQKPQAVRLTVRNIGGISDTSVEFEPGANILSGRNATNQTSLLRSIMAALESKSEVKKGRRNVPENQFELHIVRESENVTAYEDTIRHLSESEREVTGLVFALAGYLVHDVHEEVPFMLLDSVEAIDSERIAKLIEHFEPYPEHLVAALLPEDADATSDSYAVDDAI